MIGLMALLCCATADAQFILGKSVGQEYVESAIENGFFLSMQNYRVRNKETGKLYGYDGKAYFGVQYAIGVKVRDGLILPEKAMKPWAYDNNFTDYAAEYDAVSNEWLYSPIGEKAAYDSLDCTLEDCRQVGSTRVYMVHSALFDGQGFEIDTSDGFKRGWMIWFTADSDKDLGKEASVNVKAIQKDITVDRNAPYVTIDKLGTDQTIVGGIYIVPTYPRIGVVEFRLCGILVGSDDKWQICCPFVGMDISTPSSDGEGGSGTDVKEGQSGGGLDLTPIEEKTEDKQKPKWRKK